MNESIFQTSTRRRNRPSLVCGPCKKRKVRCDRERPCGQCQKNKITDKCVFEVTWNSYENVLGRVKKDSKNSSSSTSKSDHTQNLSMHFNPKSPSTSSPDDIYKASAREPIGIIPQSNNKVLMDRGVNLTMIQSSELENLRRKLAILESREALNYNVEFADSTHKYLMISKQVQINEFKTQYYNQYMSKLQTFHNVPLHDPKSPGLVQTKPILSNIKNPPILAESERNSKTKTPVIPLHAMDDLIGINPYLSYEDEINFFDGYVSTYTNGTSRRINYGSLSWYSISKKDKIVSKLMDYMSQQKYSKPELSESTNTDAFTKKQMETDGIIDMTPYYETKQNNLLNVNLDFGINELGSKYHREMKLIEKIQEHLPTQKAIWMYIDYFFTTLIPFIPFVDEGDFRHSISEVIGPKEFKYEKLHQFTVKKRLDLANISILLIILRFAYLGVKCKSSIKKSQDNEEFRIFHTFLMANPVDPIVVDLAKLCINQFEILKKINLPILQATIFLRLYTIYAPEYGDGADGGDSQVFNGMLLHMAYSIGLNREPNNFHSEFPNERENNLGRKIWYDLVISDYVLAYTFGNPMSSNLTFYDTKIPYYTPGNDNIFNSELEKTVCAFYQFCDNLIHGPMSKILKMVLNVKESTKYHQLTSQLNAMELMATSLFGEFGDYCNNLEVDDICYKYTKVLKLKVNISQKAFFLSIYYHLFLDHEKKNCAELSFFYLKKMLLISVGEFIPYLCTFIHGSAEILGPSVEIFILPNFLQTVHRSCEISIAAIIRNNTVIYKREHDPSHTFKLANDNEYRMSHELLLTLQEKMEMCARISIAVIQEKSDAYYYAWGAARRLSFFLKVVTSDDFYHKNYQEFTYPIFPLELLQNLSELYSTALNEAKRQIEIHCSQEDVQRIFAKKKFPVGTSKFESNRKNGKQTTNNNGESNYETLSSLDSNSASDLDMKNFPETLNSQTIRSGFEELNFGNEDEINSLWFDMLCSKSNKNSLTDFPQFENGVNFDETNYFNFFSDLPLDKVFNQH